MKKTARSYNSTLRGASKKTARSYNSTLNRRKRLDPISKHTNTAKRNEQWAEYCRHWIDWTIAKYGHIICWWCGEHGIVDIPDDFNAVWGHHADGNRNHCEIDNCYIAHNRCQSSEIHPNNIDVRIYPNREAWLRSKRNGD